MKEEYLTDWLYVIHPEDAKIVGLEDGELIIHIDDNDDYLERWATVVYDVRTDHGMVYLCNHAMSFLGQLGIRISDEVRLLGPRKLSVRNCFSVFLADFKAKLGL